MNPDTLYATMRPAPHLLRHGAKCVAVLMALLHANRPPAPLGVVGVALSVVPTTSTNKRVP